MRRIVVATIGAGVIGLFALPAGAQQDPGQAAAQQMQQADTLDELLRIIQQRNSGERAENQRREQEFRQKRTEQQRLLNEAKATLRREEARAERLENAFNENEQKVTVLQQQLRERLGALGELFGHVRGVAGDARANVEDSLISLQYPGREELLAALVDSKQLPSIARLRQLWYTLQQEATESGKVVRFPTTVVTAEGDQEPRDVVRVGVFNAVSEGHYLQHLREERQLVELARQPPGQHTGTIDDLEEADDGMVGFSVDPSRGQILGLLVEVPNFFERIQQGKTIGYIIIVLASVGILIAIFQWIHLVFVGRRVQGQLGRQQARSDNPLGRVLSVYDANREEDVETLELKLDEAILKETPPLERFITTIGVLAVVAPLLGLLGTVTGMIQTFQSITLFGTGDPKLMAGGISEALVTTMLGLYSAIPLTLLHSFVSGRSRIILHILDQQSAGIIARHAEAKGAERAA